MGCTPPFSSSLFVGCTWASPLSFSQMHFLLFCGIYSNLLLLREAPPMSSFVFFFAGYTHSSSFFQEAPTHPLLLLWDALAHLFYPGSTHTSAPPAFFSGMHSRISSSFFWDAPLPPPPFFCRIHSHRSFFCGIDSQSSFFQDALKHLLLFFLPPNLILCKDQFPPGPLHFPTDPNSSTCPKGGATCTQKTLLRIFLAK